MPTVISAQEILTLPTRLYGRAISQMLDDNPSLQEDLRIASRILRCDDCQDRCRAAKTDEAAQLSANRGFGAARH